MNSSEDLLYQITIPLNPITKKNGSRILYNRQRHSYFVAPSLIYERYQKNIGWLLKRKGEPISEPITVECKFYRQDKRRVDLTNLLEAIDDCLVYYKIVIDDNYNIIKSHDGSRVYVDKDNPRTEIKIYRFKEE